MKQVWRLSRGQQTLCNLTLCALLLAGLWGLMGYPLPTAELELRRWERACLMEPGEIVFSVKKDEALEGLEGGYTAQFNGPLLISVAEDRAIIGLLGAEFRNWSFSVFPLGETPLAVLTPGMLSLPVFSETGPSVCTPVLAFRLPEEAVRGEITLMGRRGTEEVPLSGPGWQVGDRVWLFAAGVVQSEGSWSLAPDAPCTLQLYQADGSPLPALEGQLGTPIQ